MAALTGVGLSSCSDDGDDGRGDGGAAPSVSTTTGVDRRVELDGRPSAVASGAQGLWVADDEAGPAAGRLQLLSPASGAPIGSAAVGPAPVALVATEAGVWSVGATGTVTLVHDPGPGPPLPVLEVDAPVEVGGALVDAVVLDGRLYVADIERSLVHVLDAVSGATVAPAVPVPAGVVRLAATGARVWVTGLEDEVTPIDAEGVVGPAVGVGLGPIGAVATSEVLWVANSDDDTLSRLDPVTGAPLGDPVPVGDAPIALALDGAVLWVLEQDGPSATPLDARTGEAAGEQVALPDGFRPRGLAVAPAGVWVVGVDPALALRLPRA